jgi:surfactin synthase thioesterase subunit
MNTATSRLVLREGPGLRLVCLPFAAGTPHSFRALARSVPADWAVVAGGHRGVPGLEASADAIAAHYLAALRTDLRGPGILLGHSMGAVIAYRMARALGAAWPSGFALVLSAPPDGFPDWHLLPDPELIEIARSFGLVPAAIDDDPLTRFVLPPLRFDLQAISGGWGPLAPLGCPTYVMTGREDVKLSRPALERLAADIGAGDVVEVAGPHMFVCTQPDDAARALVRIVDAVEHPGLCPPAAKNADRL